MKERRAGIVGMGQRCIPDDYAAKSIHGRHPGMLNDAALRIETRMHRGAMPRNDGR